MNQRPGLFRVAILKLEDGHAAFPDSLWSRRVADYGSSDGPRFKTLLYSPLHNIRQDEVPQPSSRPRTTTIAWCRRTRSSTRRRCRRRRARRIRS
jgi:hypothetical protein